MYNYTMIYDGCNCKIKLQILSDEISLLLDNHQIDEKHIPYFSALLGNVSEMILSLEALEYALQKDI